MAEGCCVSSSGLIIEPALSQRAMDHSPQFLHSKYKIQYLNFNFFFFFSWKDGRLFCKCVAASPMKSPLLRK